MDFGQTAIRLVDFNPRSHKGSDGVKGGKSAKNTDFNPRSHKGSDLKVARDTGILKISIHAPTRGATESKVVKAPKTQISIHAPTRGATVSDTFKLCG